MREMAQIVVTDRPTAEPNWTHFAKSDLPETNADHFIAVFCQVFCRWFSFSVPRNRKLSTSLNEKAAGPKMILDELRHACRTPLNVS